MTTKIIFGALVYIIPTFMLAYFWHLKWFKKKYEIWDYAGGNPSPPLGLASMIVQGIVLSVLYALGPIDRTSILDAVKFIGILAVLHWSVHVLAAMAKSPKIRNWHYFGFETFYLLLQFGLFAILISSVVY